MRFRFSNNSSALVTSTVTSTATTVTLEAGGGAMFPVLSVGDMFRATLVDSSGAKEIVEAIDVTGDIVTIRRAQEGTAAQTFSAGSRFECRLTAGMAENFLQRTGDVMNGPLDMAGNQILNPVFGIVKFVHINAQLIRPIDIDPTTVYNPTLETSSIVIPQQATGQRPSYNGSTIINQSMFSGVVLDWLGDVNHVPPWFKLCNGTNGTPDLRGRYIKGWLDTFGPGGYSGYHEVTRPDAADSFGISWGLAMDGAGAHSHGGGTDNTTLTIAQIPPHHHNITAAAGTLGNSGTGVSGTDGPKTTTDTGGGQPHAHGIFGDGHHAHWVHQPPFFVLAKVMFV